MDRVLNLSKICKEFFIEQANNLSISTGFIKRKRKITGSSFIKALILGNMGDEHCSIERMCQLLSEDSIDINKQGLNFRFTEKSVEFMQSMHTQCLHLFKNQLQIVCPILQQFNFVKLLDSSQVSLPNNMESIYKGCGSSYPGKPNNFKSAVKLQVVFDYLHQKVSRLDLTEGIRSDQGYRSHLDDIEANDLLIADLGYFVPRSFQRVSESGAYFISRYKSDTNLYEVETEQKLDLLKLLDGESFLVKEILLGKEIKLPMRLVCYKSTAEQSICRRRKANLLAKSRGYTSSEKNQRLLDWSIFITNIPEEKISSEQIYTIYKLRWQIELLPRL